MKISLIIIAGNKRLYILVILPLDL